VYGPGHTFDLKIEYQCDYTYTFQTFWEGKILLSDVSFIEGELLADVSIWDQTVFALLKSRFDQPVNILNPFTVSGNPVAHDYESANLFPTWGKNNDFSSRLVEDWRALIRGGPIAEIVGEDDHSIVTDETVDPVGSGRFGSECNMDMYNITAAYAPGSIVFWIGTIPTSTNVYRALVFVPPGNPPPNPTFWQPIPFTSQDDLGYKAEWFLRQVITFQGPISIPRLAAIDSNPFRTFLMFNPATESIDSANSGTDDVIAAAWAWLRPVVVSNSMNSPAVPSTGPVQTYLYYRGQLANHNQYNGVVPQKCSPKPFGDQSGLQGELDFFIPPATGLYEVQLECTINTEYVVGAMSPFVHDTSFNPQCSTELPSGCGSCTAPTTLAENTFGHAELWWEVLIGNTVFSPSNPGSSTGWTSGTICGKYLSNLIGINATKGNFTFNLNITGTFFMTAGSGGGIRIRLNFVQTSRYRRKVISSFKPRVAHALAVIDVDTSDCCLSVTRLTTFTALPTARIPFFGLYEVGQRLIDKLTDNGVLLRSTHLSRPGTFPLPQPVHGCGSLTWITKGFFIRGGNLNDGTLPPLDNCGITSDLNYGAFVLSFKDYMEALDALYGIGMWQDLSGNVQIEQTRFFYPDFPTLTLNLGDKKLRNFVRKFDASRAFSIFRSGYDKWETDLASSRYEFNSGRIWNLKIPYVKNELNRVCKWIGASQVFEATRRNHFFVAGTASYETDDEVFLMQMEQLTPVLQPERGVDLHLSNMILPGEQLNWRLRPSSMLKRWLPWLGQTVFNAPTSLNWIYPGKVSGNAFTGGADVTSPNLPAACNFPFSLDVQEFPDTPAYPPYLRPEIISFETVLTVSEFAVIRLFPIIRLILTFDNDPPITGWIKQLSYNPSTHIAQFEIMPRIE
jgi:hypothetical protein